MRLVYQGNFKGYLDTPHEVRIYDTTLASGGTPKSLILASPGYELNWNANISTVVKAGIIESSATIYIVNKAKKLDGLLQNLRTTENRYVVEIWRDSKIFWVGMLFQDFGKVPDLPEYVVSITATDGIGILTHTDFPDYKPDMCPSINVGSLLHDICKALSYIPTNDLYGTNAYQSPFLRVKTDWYNDFIQTGKEPLAMSMMMGAHFKSAWVKKAVKKGYNGEEIEVITYFTCKEVVEHILTRFNAIMMQVDGTWTIIQRDLLTESDTVSMHIFSKTGNAGGTKMVSTQQSVDISENTYRAGGDFTYLPGLDSVKVDYTPLVVTNYDIANSMIPWHQVKDSQTTQTVETIDFPIGVGNFIHLGVLIKQTFWPTVFAPPGGISTAVHYYSEIKCGDKYLNWNGSWSIAPAIIHLGMGIVVFHGWMEEGNVLQLLIDFELISQDVPYNLPISMQTWYVRSEPSWIEQKYITYDPYMFFVIDNANAVGSVTFEAINDANSFSIKEELKESEFGTAFSGMGRKMLWTWGGGLGTGGTGMCRSITPAEKKWEKGVGTVKTKYFNELLAAEVLANQSTMLLQFSGEVISRENLLSPFCVFVLKYKNYEYSMAINQVQYSPQTESMSGDWFEVSRTRKFLKPNVISEAISITNLIDLKRPKIPTAIATLVNNLTSRKPPYTSSDSVIITPGIVEYQQIEDIDVLVPVVGSLRTYMDSGGNFVMQDAKGDITVLKPGKPIIKYGYLYSTLILDGIIPTIPSIINSGSGNKVWRLSTHADVVTLQDLERDPVMPQISHAGKFLKSKRTQPNEHPRWDLPNTEALDSFGFNLLPGGYYSTIEGFVGKGQYGYVYNAGMHLRADFDSNLLRRTVPQGDASGESVRLCRDCETEELTLPNGTVMENYIGTDGTEYKTVKIENLVWMAENLAETKFADGTDIKIIMGKWEWTMEHYTGIGGMCAYNYDGTNVFYTPPGAGITHNQSEFIGDGTPSAPLTFNKVPFGKIDKMLAEVIFIATNDVAVADTSDEVNLLSDASDDRGSKIIPFDTLQRGSVISINIRGVLDAHRPPLDFSINVKLADDFILKFPGVFPSDITGSLYFEMDYILKITVYDYNNSKATGTGWIKLIDPNAGTKDNGNFHYDLTFREVALDLLQDVEISVPFSFATAHPDNRLIINHAVITQIK